MSDLVKIGALWKPKEQGKVVLSGKMGDARVIIFKNDKKQENHPDYTICVCNPQKKTIQNEDGNDFTMMGPYEGNVEF